VQDEKSVKEHYHTLQSRPLVHLTDGLEPQLTITSLIQSSNK
jgi:hypothetical protein